MSVGIDKKQVSDGQDTKVSSSTHGNSDRGMKQAKAAINSSRSGKSAAAFRTISEVSEDLGVQQHVLRFWETKFPQVKPLKRGGGRRYYRPEDISLLQAIYNLLYVEGYTIKGVQKLLREVGKNQIIANFSGAASTDSTLYKRGEGGDSSAIDTSTGQNGVQPLTDKQRQSLENVLAELKELRGMVKRK